MIYCTLFDSNYLDRGLVCIKSIIDVDHEAKIYILCMDDICYSVLLEEELKGTVLIKLSDFEDNELKSIKNSRLKGEYCWSCTAKLIKYVLLYYSEKICTYVDADLMFFSNPSVLLDEMMNNKCCVQVIPHNFAPDYMKKERIKHSGMYCVQFNTFTQDKKSLDLLDDWIKKCLRHCSVEDGGDQKYMDAWVNLDYVNKSKILQAGIAPWNVNRFKLINTDSLEVLDKYSKKKGNIIFYHYQDLVFPQPGKARIVPYLYYWNFDKKLIKLIYNKYLENLYKMNQYLLKRYGIKCLIIKYISENDYKERYIISYIKKFFDSSIAIKVNFISNRMLHKLRKKECLYDFPPKLD